MSSTVDQRIVQMKFDNAQFEREAQTSLETIERLKSSLNMDKSVSGLEKIKDKIGSFNVATISDGVDGLNIKFNALGIAGAEAVRKLTDNVLGKLGSALTNTLGRIKTGGLNRALNLEQANFSMQGLLYTTDEMGNRVAKYGMTVEDVMGPDGPVQKSVKGTAFGLDEAAVAASNFIGSGIRDVGELENALTSISGTASQAGASYSEIARIYQKVAAQGRLMGDDLNSLSSRSVNASAAIAEYLNGLEGEYDGMSDQFFEAMEKIGKYCDFTEADVREMVSRSGIQFDVFSNAMYEAFGENAFRANETYSGSLNNMYAALSRLGAKFQSVYLVNMRDIFNAIRPLIDSISKALDPLITKFNNWTTAGTGKLVGFLGKLNTAIAQYGTFYDVRKFVDEEEFEALNHDYFQMQNLAQALEFLGNSLFNFGSGFVNIFKYVTSGVKDLVGSFDTKKVSNFAKNIFQVSTRFKDLTTDTQWLNYEFKPFKKILEAVISVFKLLSTSLVGVWSSFSTYILPIIADVGGAFLSVIGYLASFITYLSSLVTENNLVTNSFKFLGEFINGVFGPIIQWVRDVIFSFTDDETKLSGALGGIGDGFEGILKKVSEWLGKDHDFSVVGETIVFVLDKIRGAFSLLGQAVEYVKDLFDKFVNSSLFQTISGFVGTIINSVSNAISSVVEFASPIIETVKNAFQTAIDWTSNKGTSSGSGYGIFGSIVNKLVGFDIVGLVTKILGSVDSEITNSILNIIRSIGNIPIIDSLKSFFMPIKDWFVSTFSFGDSDFSIVSEIGGFLKNALSGFEEWITNGADFSFISEKVVGALETLKNVFADIKSFIVPILQTLAMPFKYVASGVQNLITTVIDLNSKYGILETISAGFSKFGEYLSSAWDSLKNLDFDTVASFATEAFNKVLEVFNSLRNADFSAISSAITKAFGAVKRFISNFLDQFPALKQVVNEVWSALKTLFEEMKPIVIAIGEVISAPFYLAGKAILSLSTTIAELHKKYGTLGMISAGFKKVGEYISAAWNYVKRIDFSGVVSVATSAFNSIKNGLTSLIQKLPNLKQAAMDAWHSLKTIFVGEDATEEGAERKVGIIEKITTTYQNLKKSLSKIVKPIADFFSKLKKAIEENIDFGNLFKNGALLGLTAMLGSLSALFLQLKTSAKGLGKNLTGVGKSISGFLDTISKSVKGEGASKVSSLRDIAIALLIIAGAIALLSLVSPDDLVTSTMIIGVVLIELEKFIEAVNKMTMKAKNIIVASTAVLMMAIGIGYLSKSVAELANVGYEKLYDGVIAVSMLMAVIMAFIKVTSESLNNMTDSSLKSIWKVAAMLLGMALSIRLLVGAVEELGALPFDQLLQGGVAVGALILALTYFIQMAKYGTGDLKGGAAVILAVAVAVRLLVGAVKELGVLATEHLDVALAGLGAVGAIILALGVFMKLAGNSSFGISGGAGILLLVASLYILIGAIVVLGELATHMFGVIAAGLGVMAASLLLIGVAMRVMPHDMLSKSAGMMMLSVSLLALAAALKVMGSLSLGEMGVALLGLGGGLAIIVGAILLLAKVAPVMLVICGGLALFGAAIALVGVGVSLLATNMVLFASQFVAAMVIFGEGVVAFGPTLQAAITVLFESILLAINDLGELIKETLGTLLEIIGETLVEYTPKIVEWILQIILGILVAIEESIQPIVESVVGIITAVINGLAESLPDLLDAGANLIVSFIGGLGDAIENHAEELGHAGWNLVEGIINGLITGIGTFTGDAVEALGGLGSDMFEEFKTWINESEFLTQAKETVQGLIDGIGQKVSDAIQAIKDLGSDVWEEVKSWFSIEKWKERGGEVVNGLIEGIGGLLGGVKQSAKDLGTAAIDSTESTLEIKSPSRVFKRIGENCVEGMKQGLEKDSSITSQASTLGSNILGKIGNALNFTKISEVTRRMMDNVKKGITDSSKTAYQSSQDVGKSMVDSLKNGIDAAKDVAVSKAGEVGTVAVQSMTKSIGSQPYTIGRNMGQGFKEGLASKKDELYNYAYSLAKSILDAVKRALNIKSPSREFKEIGVYCVEGLENGLSDTKDVEKTAYKLSDKLLDAFYGITDMDADPTIRPVLDLSEIQNGVNTLDGMLSNRPSIAANVAGNLNTSVDYDQNATLKSMNDVLNKILTSVANSDDSLTEKLAEMFSNTKVVLDSGALVGNISMDMDNALGRISINRMRGVI